MKKRITGIPQKMKGSPQQHQPLSLKFAVWGTIAGTASIVAILTVTKWSGYPLLIAPFGASAVLVFGACDSAYAQPRNLVGGHLVSAIIAVLLNSCAGSCAMTISLAVGLSILVMYLTRTLHPPGGATALIGVQGHATSSFLFMPILVGSLFLLVLALLINNVVHHRRYPLHWW